MSYDRRAFLAAFGSAALALSSRSLIACAAPADDSAGDSSAGARRKLPRLGLQLYTVRDQMQKDLPGTLARVAEIGYRDVEFAGYFGRKPEEIRALLDQHKLRAPSAHVGLPVLGESWTRVLNDAKIVGHEYVVAPWIPQEARGGADAYRRFADLFNRAAQQAKDAGLRFAYHNHDFEFATVDGGAVPMEILLDNTDKSLVEYEMDLYWVVKAGRDPIALLDRYPGRFALVHVKDATAAPERTITEVGSGTIDFKRIFAHDADHGAHIKYFFVEHDQPKDAFASAKQSYDYLAKLAY
jgi:sugar phosphate isomerase/epimerase